MSAHPLSFSSIAKSAGLAVLLGSVFAWGGAEHDLSCDDAFGAINIGRYRKLKADLKSKAREKIAEDDAWDIDGIQRPTTNHIIAGNNFPYDETFQSLAHASISDIISRRKKSGKPTNVLDLFGSGVFLPDQSQVDSMTGVRLLDRKFSDQLDAPPARRDVVEGNLFELSTWKALDSSLNKNKVEKLDLIFIRPMGATLGVAYAKAGLSTEFNAAFFSVLRKAYARLSSDDGELYAKIPTFFPIDLLKESLKEKGVDIEADRKNLTVRIRKHGSSPVKLPIPSTFASTHLPEDEN